MRPSGDAHEILTASLDKLAALDSFVVHINVDIGAIDQSPSSHVDGKIAYANRATAYYTIALQTIPSSPETMIVEYLLLPPDLYLHSSDAKWYVQSPWNQGIKPEELPDAGSLDPINQYQDMIEGITDIAAVPDDTIGGRSYLRFKGANDPDGQANIWIDADTGLPHKFEFVNTITSAWGASVTAPATSVLEFTDFNQPPTPPEAPSETRPIRDLQLPQALCTGAAFAGCAEAQAGLASVASTSCDGTGRRICVVPLGQIDPTLLQDLVAYYQQQYGLKVAILTPEPVPTEFASNLREQVDASRLISYMTGLFPGTDNNSAVVLIGLTPLDIYDSTSTFRYLFGLKGDVQTPKGMLSTFRMDPRTYGEPADTSMTFTRTQRMLSKYIGLMYYGLPTSHDPHSAMFDSILGVDDLDAMTDPLDVPSN